MQGETPMIYVDPIRHYPSCKLPYKDWCHLATDGDLEALHAFAARLGLKRSWFQQGHSGRFPHYDLTPFKRRLAIQLGAASVNPFELIRLCYPQVWELITAGSERRTVHG
jgi:hypothetical protein